MKYQDDLCTAKNYKTASKFVKVMPRILLPLAFQARYICVLFVCMYVSVLAVGDHER